MRMRLKTIISIAASLAVLSLAVYGIAFLAPSYFMTLESQTWVRDLPRVPHFSAKNARGGYFTLGNVAGRPVVLTFWTSWNEAAVRQLDTLKKLRSSVPSAATLVAVNSQESLANLESVMKTHANDITFLMDEDGEIGERYDVSVLPLTVFIDEFGRETDRVIGPLSADDIRAKIPPMR